MMSPFYFLRRFLKIRRKLRNQEFKVYVMELAIKKFRENLVFGARKFLDYKNKKRTF